uniref:DUF5683 domain-containing protein n=1 Tax=Heterorhabditis bacteriophora TaxID=37862 RepID=A0A1I7WRF7_HETBA
MFEDFIGESDNIFARLNWNYNLRQPMKGSNYRIGDLILGFYGGLWAYSGWDVLNYSTGEIAKPRR